MERAPAQTSPPTFTSHEVSAIFHGAVTPSSLQHLDRTGLLRPSFYFDALHPGNLMPQKERNSASKTKVLRRRYSYTDLVWIRLFVSIRDAFSKSGTANCGRQAARAIAAIRASSNETCPPSWRIVLLGRELYLIRDDAIAECLTKPGQMGFVELLETVEAEVRGRVTALSAHRKIRELPSQQPQGFRKQRSGT